MARLSHLFGMCRWVSLMAWIGFRLHILLRPTPVLTSVIDHCYIFSWSTAFAVDQTPLEGSKPAGIARAFVRAQPHPLVKGACLILVGTSSGYVTAWELTDTRQVASAQALCMQRLAWLAANK